MTQMTLFETSCIDAEFDKFHRDNPKVMEMFLKFAWEAKVYGRKRIGAKAIIERMRWQTTIETTGEPWKLNNSYTSRYARLAIKENPELAGLFTLRELRA